ncbi:hypothetical protein [Nocardiopsis sp. NPDC055824]
MKFPQRSVVDTNVLIAANGRRTHVSRECSDQAVDFLEHCTQGAVVVVDNLGRILSEYEDYCNYSGQPGVGDHFFLYVHRRQASQNAVVAVEVPVSEDGDFLDIPDSLQDFDPSDKKFVAVVLADKCESQVVNCSDSDWLHAFVELEGAGVRVFQLCPECLKGVS